MKKKPQVKIVATGAVDLDRIWHQWRFFDAADGYTVKGAPKPDGITLHAGGRRIDVVWSDGSTDTLNLTDGGCDGCHWFEDFRPVGEWSVSVGIEDFFSVYDD